jgi:hypothetical protein
MCGIRVNGLTGLTEAEQASDRSSLGRRSYFVTPHAFEVEAPLGARVELFVNDRRMDTAPVFVNTMSPGLGLYRFESVRLPPGVLNEVRMVVTDENGQQTETRVVEVGSTQLLPKGRTAYIAGLGRSREIGRWRANGIFVGGRALHGVTDRLTVGGSLAYQQDFFERSNSDGGTTDRRRYPRESLHIGAQVAWQPIERLMLTGDFSSSMGSEMDDGGSFGDTAYRFHADYYPNNKTVLYADYFRYGSSFFNGNNLDLHDREGFYVGGSWQGDRRLTARASAGKVWNGVDGDTGNRLIVDFQTAEITSRLFPGATLSFETDRIAPEGLDPQVIYTVRVVASIFAGMELQAHHSEGDTLMVADDPNFFSGIPLPGLTVLREPSSSVSISKTFNSEHSAGVTWWKGLNRERISAAHNYRSGGEKKLLMRTEIGQETTTSAGDAAGRDSRSRPYFENRTELTLDETGTRRVGLQTRLERDQWRALLYVDIADTFAYDRGRPSRIVDRRIRPSAGAIHGRVFLDYNANGELDPGEPGLEGIRVAAGRFYNSITDEDGYYMLPGLNNVRKVRVSLDIDTVSAIHHPTHGTQVAEVTPGCLTEVNLGVAPSIVITGYVLARSGIAESVAVCGVRVFIAEKASGKMVADSITASDGSYYLGDLLPGKYILQIDPATLPGRYLMGEHIREIELKPVREAEEIQMLPFNAVARELGEDQGRPQIVLGAKTSDARGTAEEPLAAELAMPPGPAAETAP